MLPGSSFVNRYGPLHLSETCVCLHGCEYARVLLLVCVSSVLILRVACMCVRVGVWVCVCACVGVCVLFVCLLCVHLV